MKNPELYHRTVDILVKAYVDGVLMPMTCSACAVGNLVAVNMGYSVTQDKDGFSDRPYWMDSGNKYQHPDSLWAEHIRGKEITQESQAQVDSTGYSEKELYSIE